MNPALASRTSPNTSDEGSPAALAPARLAFTLHLAAALAFGAAFVLPFVRSDFEVQLSAGTKKAGQIAFDPCGSLSEATGLPLPEALCAPLRNLGAGAGGAALDATLGEVDPTLGVGWTECMKGSPTSSPPQALPQTREDATPGLATKGSPVEGDSRAQPAQERLAACAKTWIIQKAGVPVGVRTLPDMLTSLWQAQERALFALILAFSVVLPLVKLMLGLGLSARPSSGSLARATFWMLRATSRFAMTDVFVVALIIVFFRAETLNFRFYAEAGAFAFAAGALLSSLALWAIERRLRFT